MKNIVVFNEAGKVVIIFKGEPQEPPLPRIDFDMRITPREAFELASLLMEEAKKAKENKG